VDHIHHQVAIPTVGMGTTITLRIIIIATFSSITRTIQAGKII
jgi:hypothetical protein